MPNKLTIPFKSSYQVDVKQPVRNFISEHTESHPDQFKWDLNRWQTLRNASLTNAVSLESVNPKLEYHAQLVSILTKLPDNIGLEIPYEPLFSRSALPVTLSSLTYERTSVVFNIGALYSQLSQSQDQSSDDGLKRAKQFSETAAGVFKYMIAAKLSRYSTTSEEEESLLELSEPFLAGLEALMLAQAQESAWQLAMSNNHLYKNGVLAKLAEQTSVLYQSALQLFRDALPPVKHILPKDWLPHIESKKLHFAAVAQYRKALDDSEASRYGHELGRLLIARDAAKKGYDIARRNGVASAVASDIKSLLDKLAKDVGRAERDNDLIYHQDVLDASTLPPIVLKGAMLAVHKVPPALNDPPSALGTEGAIFGELVSWGALEAINIYNHNKDNLISEQIVGHSIQLDDKVSSTLRSLNLPAALEVLEKPVGLPPSLLKKAEEVRTEDGVTKIEMSIENVQTLAENVAKLLDEAMDILDGEASEDETARKEHNINRPPSHQANEDLVKKERRYRSILKQATASDELVRVKWDEWETNITELTWDEASLESSVPSSAISLSSPGGGETQKHARALRVQLEALEDLRRSRAQLVQRAQRLAEADDIKSVIVQKARGFEQFTEIQPAMFADISDAQLYKYDRFIGDIEEMGRREDTILKEIATRNELFLQSRCDDPTVKGREHALQTLDLAYHKYREISRNLDEGIKFYNDLAGIINDFKLTCETWSRIRRSEIQSLVESVQGMSVRDSQEVEPVAPPANEEEREPPVVEPVQHQKPTKKPAFKFPAPNSSDWESLELPPAPTAAPAPARKKKSVPLA